MIGVESECLSLAECSSKDNRGVEEVFSEATRISLRAKPGPKRK